MRTARLLYMAMLVLTASACAGTSAPDRDPIDADLSALAPAEQALQELDSANARQAAPRALDAARRRLSLARDIIYAAALEGRRPDEAEQRRITNLVEGARLDARLARVRAQVHEVDDQLAQVRQELADTSTSIGGED